jgi:glycosyltransferase involved in cell wall biosynthesis
MDLKNIGFIVTTLGRIEPLKKLLSSLVNQITSEDSIVIIAQDNEIEVKALIQDFNYLPIKYSTSGRGASLGRNVGVKILKPKDQILLFPNDTTSFPDGIISQIRPVVSAPEFKLGAMTVIDDLGPIFELPPPGTTLDKINVWRVIEHGLLIRRNLFEELGGYNQNIGSGTNTPWQSGEGTDLILRALDKWPALATQFSWFPSEMSLRCVNVTHGLNKSARRQKLLAYGRGLGWVARHHNYSLSWKLKRLIGGAVIGILHSNYEVIDGWWGFRGRFEGMIGKTIGAESYQAVTK